MVVIVVVSIINVLISMIEVKISVMVADGANTPINIIKEVKIFIEGLHERDIINGMVHYHYSEP